MSASFTEMLEQMAGIRQQFRVRICNVRGVNITPKDAGGTSDPYVKINFDNYHIVQTPAIPKTLSPIWLVDEIFEYTTQQIDRLVCDGCKFDANTLGVCRPQVCDSGMLG